MRASRVRPFVLAVLGLPLVAAVAALSATADAAEPFAATATISGGPQYLGDTTGTVVTFTVTNTGTSTPLGAVEIERPSLGWSIISCGVAPSGWTAQKADPRCRFRSAEGGADDILPGQSRSFSVRVATLPGTADRVGTWNVTVSRSNQFDQPSLLAAAESGAGDLRTTAHSLQVVDAVVADAAVAAGSACPPADKDAQTSAVVVMVVCGRNHATTLLTPGAAHSSLGGTFVAAPGTFSSGPIAVGAGPVVLGSWTGTRVAPLPAQGLTVVAAVGAAADQTSPLTTLGGYEAINAAPLAGDDAYSVAEDGTLTPAAPGVLADDSDPEGQALTAVLESGPAHAAAFTLYADGSFGYVPAPDFAGTDSFTYRAFDGIQGSAPATVVVTVTPVNDAPVNTVPAAVATDEDTAYAFGPGALAVADVDAGGAAVETRLTVPGATLTVGTTGVTVAGNGTGDVTVTGPVASVVAALDAATLTPAADDFGTLTLTVATSDLGHTGSGGALTDTDTVAVTVRPVNDAPSFTAGPDQTVVEDAGARTVAGWATDIDKGAANESGQTLTFEVTTDAAALFAVPPAVDATGTLTYTPAPDASGVANVSVLAYDDGGGWDTSPTATFTITVTPVNDPPAVVDHARAAQANMRLHVTGLLAGATDPHDAGTSYTPSFTLTSVTPASCAGCGVANVSADGSFDFDPPAGGTGTYTLHYTVTDTGDPAPGATSAPGTITVTVGGPVIWFVDPTATTAGSGTLTDPFRTLTSAAAVASGTGDRVFVGSGTVAGGITQPTNGWLVGQGVSGASFDAVFGIAPPAGTAPRPSIGGTRPVVQGSVALGDSSVVRGLDVAPAAGTPGLVGSGDDGVTVAEVSVATTGARAVDLRGSQGSTVTLDSVDAGNAPSGIHLEDVNTVTAGTVTVAGGTVAGSTGAGVHLVDVTGVSLTDVAITRSAAEGVFGSNAADVALTDVTVTDSGTHGIAFANARGATTLTRVTSAGSAGDNARVFGSTGSSTVTVADSTFRDNSATSGGNGLLVAAAGDAAMTFTGTGNSFLRNHQDGLAVLAASTRRMVATVTGGTYVVDFGVGLDIVSNGAGGLAYAVDGGTVTGCATCGAPVNVYKATGGTGTGVNAMAGSIRGMTIANGDSGNAPGIWVHAEGAGASRVAVTDNTVLGVGHHGILVAAGNGGSTMDATVTGNTVTLPASGLQGIQVDAGLLTGDTAAVCADIRANTVSSPTADVRVRNRQAGTTFRLPGYTGAATSTTEVAAFEVAQNTITDAAAVVGSSPGFGGGAACAAP